MYRLSRSELETYENDGLVIPDCRLSDDLFSEIRSVVKGVIEKTSAEKPDFTLVAHIPLREGVEDGAPDGDRIFSIATSAEVLGYVEQVLGPDVVFWGSSIFAKPAGVGKKVQWHQDSRWWPMRPLVTCTMWIAIDETTPENGCLRYIPGSHAWEVMPHLDQVEQGLLGSSIDEAAIDQSSARDVLLKPGRFSLHQANLVHGSEPNSSPRPRAGLVLRYMPATSHFDRSDAEHLAAIGVMKTGDVPRYGHRPIWLVRGENRRPGNDFACGHQGLEDLDAMAEAARACGSHWSPRAAT
jgi:hypothetical protein